MRVSGVSLSGGFFQAGRVGVGVMSQPYACNLARLDGTVPQSVGVISRIDLVKRRNLGRRLDELSVHHKSDVAPLV